MKFFGILSAGFRAVIRDYHEVIEAYNHVIQHNYLSFLHVSSEFSLKFFFRPLNTVGQNNFGNKITYLLKFIYSEKATKCFEIFILLLSYVVPVKSKVNISQNLVAFSEYMYLH